MKPAHTLSAKQLRARVLFGLSQGRPVVGPQNVHIDVTNGCNAACIASPIAADFYSQGFSGVEL